MIRFLKLETHLFSLRSRLGMGEPLRKLESGENSVWITQPNEIENILRRRQIAYGVAKGKTKDCGGKIETAMQTAEAFGRGLFEELIKQENKDWTISEWVKPVVKNIFNPMGTGATFTKISEDEAKSMVFRYRHKEDDDLNLHFDSLFNYGFLRGMLLSAFPDGELIMQSSMVQGAQVDEFIFKANADEEDRFERERIKNSFTEQNSVMKN